MRQVKACYCFQNAAKAYGKGAARYLKAGYCLTSLSAATRKVLRKRPESCKSFGKGAAMQVKACYCLQNAAKAYGKGAARYLKAGYCLTSLSEATRKFLESAQNVAKASRMQQKPMVRALRGI